MATDSISLNALHPEHAERIRLQAERAIREYRDHDELVTEQTAEGILVKMRAELALALDDLETAITTDTTDDDASAPADHTLRRVAAAVVALYRAGERAEDELDVAIADLAAALVIV